MWKEKPKLLVQADKISTENALNKYLNDSERSYNTNTMIIRVKFQLPPMGVLAHRLRTLDRSLVPPSA